MKAKINGYEVELSVEEFKEILVSPPVEEKVVEKHYRYEPPKPSPKQQAAQIVNGIRRNRWSREDDQLLAAWWNKDTPNKTIAKRLHRSTHAIANRVALLRRKKELLVNYHSSPEERARLASFVKGYWGQKK